MDHQDFPVNCKKINNNQKITYIKSSKIIDKIRELSFCVLSSEIRMSPSGRMRRSQHANVTWSLTVVHPTTPLHEIVNSWEKFYLGNKQRPYWSSIDCGLRLHWAGRWCRYSPMQSGWNDDCSTNQPATAGKHFWVERLVPRKTTSWLSLLPSSLRCRLQ